MDDRIMTVLAAFVIITLLVVSGVWYFNSRADCDRRGGALVRGAWGYECVATPNR